MIRQTYRCSDPARSGRWYVTGDWDRLEGVEALEANVVDKELL